MGRALKREALKAAQDVDHPMSGSDPSTTLKVYSPHFVFLLHRVIEV